MQNKTLYSWVLKIRERRQEWEMLRARINASMILSRASLESEMWPKAPFVLLVNAEELLAFHWRNITC